MKKLILISALVFFSANSFANKCADNLYRVYRDEGYCKLIRAAFIDKNGTEIYVREIYRSRWDLDLKNQLEESFSCNNVEFKPAFDRSTGFPVARVLKAQWSGKLGKHVNLCAIIVNGKDYYPK